jgi:hypothetical protein
MKIRAALAGKDFSGTEWISQWLCARMWTPTQTSLPVVRGSGLGMEGLTSGGLPDGCAWRHRLRLIKIRAALTGEGLGTGRLAQWLCVDGHRLRLMTIEAALTRKGLHQAACPMAVLKNTGLHYVRVVVASAHEGLCTRWIARWLCWQTQASLDGDRSGLGEMLARS